MLTLWKALIMETIIINTKNSGNTKLILELVKKIGETGRILTKSEEEDFLLGELMLSERTGKKVSKSTILKTLREK